MRNWPEDSSLILLLISSNNRGCRLAFIKPMTKPSRMRETLCFTGTRPMSLKEILSQWLNMYVRHIVIIRAADKEVIVFHGPGNDFVRPEVTTKVTVQLMQKSNTRLSVPHLLVFGII